MAEKTSELGLNDADESKALSTVDTENEIALRTTRDDVEASVDEQETANGDDGATDETEQLREQIEETRRGMSETIDAIQEKLSFSNISEQVQAQVSEQITGAVETAKDVLYGKAGDLAKTVSRGFKEIGGTDLAKRAQQNPAALAIIGAGVGALLVSLLVGGKSGKRKPAYNYDYDYQPNEKRKEAQIYTAKFDKEENFDDVDFDNVRYADGSRRELQPRLANESGQSNSSAANKISETTNSAYESVAGAADSAYKGIGSAASSTYESVGDAAGKAYEGVSGLASKTYSGLGTAAGYTYEKAGDLGGQVKINYDYYIEENPLAVGAVALALGAAVGLAIPLTRKENEYMGEYRDQLVDRAQDAAQDAIGSVKQMAADAQKAITEEVKSKTA